MMASVVGEHLTSVSPRVSGRPMLALSVGQDAQEPSNERSVESRL